MTRPPAKLLAGLALLAAAAWLLLRKSADGKSPVEIGKLGAELALPENKAPTALQNIAADVLKYGGTLSAVTPDFRVDIQIPTVESRLVEVVDTPTTVSATVTDIQGRRVPLDAVFEFVTSNPNVNSLRINNPAAAAAGKTAIGYFRDPTGQLWTVPINPNEPLPTVGTNVAGQVPVRAIPQAENPSGLTLAPAPAPDPTPAPTTQPGPLAPPLAPVDLRASNPNGLTLAPAPAADPAPVTPPAPPPPPAPAADPAPLSTVTDIQGRRVPLDAVFEFATSNSNINSFKITNPADYAAGKTALAYFRDTTGALWPVAINPNNPLPTVGTSVSWLAA